MKYLALLAAWMALPIAAFSQCSPNPAGGTQCVAPLSTTVPAGETPTTAYQLTPATAANPCPPGQAIKVGRYFLCGQGNALTVDFGDGKDYVSLKGDKGDIGPQGDPGPPWSPVGHKYTVACPTAAAAKGGKGVPAFSVTNLILTGCSITQTQ